MKPNREPAGSVLIFTLWLAAGLAGAALLVGHTSMLHYRREANFEARLRADHAVDGALRYVLQVLTAATPGILPAADSYQAEDLSVGDCRVWLLGRSDDVAAETPVFALTDEAGKLNLNTATQSMLEALPGMPLDLAGAMVDWRDPDSDISPNGAESESYQTLTPPYLAKNSPFETSEELRLLRGATPILLTGRDRNRNTLLEWWEKTLVENARTRVTAIPDLGILEHVTVFSREPVTTPDGQTRTDLNGRPEAVGQALNTLFGSSRAAAVAAAANVGRTTFTSVLGFCIQAKLTDSEASQAWDRFTVGSSPGAASSGRIHVNTASAAVLACVPELGETNAAKLVAYRRQNSNNLNSPLWVVSAIGETAALAAGPYLTVRSYQVTADIVAVAPHGRGFRRARFVIDTTTGKPIVVSRRDLSHLGWPLGDTLYRSITRPDYRQDGSST